MRDSGTMSPEGARVRRRATRSDTASDWERYHCQSPISPRSLVAMTACTKTISAALPTLPWLTAAASAPSTTACETTSASVAAAVSPRFALRLRHMTPSASRYTSPYRPTSHPPSPKTRTSLAGGASTTSERRYSARRTRVAPSFISALIPFSVALQYTRLVRYHAPARRSGAHHSNPSSTTNAPAPRSRVVAIPDSADVVTWRIPRRSARRTASSSSENAGSSSGASPRVPRVTAATVRCASRA